MSSRSLILTDHTAAADAPWVAEQLALMRICMQLGVPFQWRSRGTFLIAGRRIEAVLNAVIAEGYEVLGLDGFDLNEVEVRPRLDLIYDRDRPDGRWQDPISAARGFGPSVWFDVTSTATLASDFDELTESDLNAPRPKTLSTSMPQWRDCEEWNGGEGAIAKSSLGAS